MPLLPQPELHPVFETLGYVGGYLLYRGERQKRGDLLQDDNRWLIIAAAAVGALVGSRFLGILEEWPRPGFDWHMFFAVSGGGKTIVGGLLSGWVAVEIVKRLHGIRARTGDIFAVPLCVGIAIGRIGCFFAGIADDTYGKPTSLPWGVNFGDGIPRHPTQLYEFVFLIALALVLHRWEKRPHGEGEIFRGFLAAYLGWRFLIDFIKPQPLFYELNMIQWACLLGLIALAFGEVARDGGLKNVRESAA
jgi:phosphatidylglycerol:prolipoprotein diacylglycerol transferase